MRKAKERRFLVEIPLVDRLRAMVDAWREDGYPGVSDTTRELLDYWFLFPPAGEAEIYPCQREALETLIYCYECLVPQLPANQRNIHGLYDLAYPEFLTEHPDFAELLRQETEIAPFPKFTLKMATGSGKTWVLGMALVWQMMNALREREPEIQFSRRFLVVAPGTIVYDRLLTFFLGPVDPVTKNRIREKADFRRQIFVPQEPESKELFSTLDIITAEEMKSRRRLPDKPFVIITYWHKLFRRKSENLLTETLQAEVEEERKDREEDGELYDRLLKDFPDLVVFNDEAHHIHREKEGEWTEWAKSIKRIHSRLRDEHRGGGILVEADFSATPFYAVPGTGNRMLKQHFPTIIYNYDLVQAQRDLLVKQVHLEERERYQGETLSEMDYRAIRGGDGRRVALSPGQKLMLQMGLEKLEQIQSEFDEKGIRKKPVLFVVAEENEVADLVYQFLAHVFSPRGSSYQAEALVIHSDRKGELSEEEWEKLKQFVYGVDDPENPYRILISVLMLREGFDVKNICVEVVLRTSGGWLAEQIVGRGIRPMFTEPEFMQMKRETYENIRNKRKPDNSLDFLFIVEHPTFRSFYEDLEREGHLISYGSSTGISVAGDLVTIRPEETRVSQFDMAFPVCFHTKYPEVEIALPESEDIPPYPEPLENLQTRAQNIIVSDRHIVENTVTKRWNLPLMYLSYPEYLRRLAEDLLRSTGLPPSLWVRLVGALDACITIRLFGKSIIPDDISVLRALCLEEVYDHLLKEFRQRLEASALTIPDKYVQEADWRFVSKAGERNIRLSASVEVKKSVYLREPVPHYGGAEKKFIQEVLEPAPISEVQSFVKNDRRIGLMVPYMGEKNGRKRLQTYYPDFLVKTDQAMYLIEIKGGHLLDKQETVHKALGARDYCKKASRVRPPDTVRQPQKFEYILIPDHLLESHSGAGFERLISVAGEWTRDWLGQALGGRLPFD
jgi:type III restriction enzyme